MRERVTLIYSLTHSIAHHSLRFHLACHPLPLFVFLASAFHPTGVRGPPVEAGLSWLCPTNDTSTASGNTLERLAALTL